MQTAYGDDYPGKRKKILILGAGNAQIDLIRYCKRMGMEVLGCSYSDFDPGIPLLDHFEQINITDVPGVIAYAERESVDFIYSVGSDIAMPTAARAMDALEMPCLFPVWAPHPQLLRCGSAGNDGPQPSEKRQTAESG